jgi:hypothetical protein
MLVVKTVLADGGETLCRLKVGCQEFLVGSWEVNFRSEVVLQATAI